MAEEKYKPVNEIWDEILVDYDRDTPPDVKCYRVAYFAQRNNGEKSPAKERWVGVPGGWTGLENATAYAAQMGSSGKFVQKARVYFGVEKGMVQ